MMNNRLDTDNIKPRDIADKSIPGSLQKAIVMALEVESKAVRTSTKSFNTNRYTAKANIPDYDELKNAVREIKENAITDLPNLLFQLENSIKQNGGTFYLAKSAEEASTYITEICRKHKAKLVVKAKSITSEEIKLNHHLENAGIKVAETDLAEFILQVSDEQPSHIVAPAIHRSRERISELFKKSFNTDLPLETGEDLTKFAKDILRDKFLTADVGISGANVIAADTGTLLLVESEGNIRMVTQAPPVHIAVAGIEKVIYKREDLWKFLELLAPSATGQNLTSYTHIIKPPLKVPTFSFSGNEKKQREFHLVLVDNGRTVMRNDKILREALYCIRCSACMNVCANFQAVGGHAFGGETYPGGIGGSWEAGTGNLNKAKFSNLCSGCSRCITECPVKIDIPWLNENLRNRLNSKSNAQTILFIFKELFKSKKDDENALLQKQFFGNYNVIAKWGSRFPKIANIMTGLKLRNKLTDSILQIDSRRKLPKFTPNTLVNQGKKINSSKAIRYKRNPQILIFADSFTNYGRPKAGIATLKIFQKLGFDVIISNVGNEGRDSLSQGLLSTTKARAKQTSQYLKQYLEHKYDIIVIEPSVLALFRKDYEHFIGKELFNKLKNNSYEPIEYLYKVCCKDTTLFRKLFNIEAIQNCPKVFYHSHCQQRSIATAESTTLLLRELGFKVDTSTVECCGMAGSFGYKKQYYDLSVRVGEELIEQINKSKNNEEMVVITSGLSCHHQIDDLGRTKTIHPIELLVKYLK